MIQLRVDAFLKREQIHFDGDEQNSQNLSKHSSQGVFCKLNSSLGVKLYS